MKEEKIVLTGNNLTLDQLEPISRGADIEIAPFVHKRIDASRNFVKKLVNGKKPIYGVNTGFGHFANTKIKTQDLLKLQSNILKSHAAGNGNPLTIPETRLAMVLRLNVLVKGYTGVRFELCEALLNLIKAEIYPIIPELGSVGASGDLAPLAHLALPLIGLGDVYYRGKIVSAKKALQSARLKPIKLAEKEGLGLINGTQVMLSVGGLALMRARHLVKKADKITALTYEAMQGSQDALNPLIHNSRGQIGQISSAQAIREELIPPSGKHTTMKSRRLQDPYSMRCAPQIHGPSRDALNFASGIVQSELNGATDNPLVFVDHHCILSGGNFHGQPLAMAFDIAAIAVSELANVSDRRLEVMMNPHLSGLHAFLTPVEGVNSGYMAAQYLSAALVNENKILSHPAITDSIPGNVGIEDHVSMGMTSARKLRNVVDNAHRVLAVEMLAACQALDLRNIAPEGRGTRHTYDILRSLVPTLNQDRIIAEDIALAIEAFKYI
jgi:histidine ammonia-lyase